MDSGHQLARTLGVELGGKLSLVLRTAAVGEGPAGRAGKLGMRHPPVGLPVQEDLLDERWVEVKPSGNPVGGCKPHEADGVEGQQGGI